MTIYEGTVYTPEELADARARHLDAARRDVVTARRAVDAARTAYLVAIDEGITTAPMADAIDTAVARLEYAIDRYARLYDTYKEDEWFDSENYR